MNPADLRRLRQLAVQVARRKGPSPDEGATAQAMAEVVVSLVDQLRALQKQVGELAGPRAR